MKSKILVLGAIACLFMLASCGESKEEKMKKTAKEIVWDFVEADYDGFYKLLDPSVAGQYPASQLASVNSAMTMILGKYKGMGEMKMTTLNNMPTVNVVTNYENGGVLYQVMFNEQGWVTGFVPSPMVNEVIYEEEDIMVTDSMPAMPDSTAAKKTIKK